MRRKRALLRHAFCLALTLAATAPGSAQSTARTVTPSAQATALPTPSEKRASTRAHARKLSDAPGVDYAAEVTPGLLRGSQPTAATIAWLKQRGVRTVINLRQFRYRDEGKLVRAAGMHYEHIPLAASDAPSDEAVARFLALVTDPALQPVYVHCAQGVDRTGTLMAIYRMEVESWSNADAYAEMKAFGAHRLWWDLRRFVRNYQRKSEPSQGLAKIAP